MKVLSPMPSASKSRNLSPPYLENDNDTLSREEIDGPVPVGFGSSNMGSKKGRSPSKYTGSNYGSNDGDH